MWQKCFSNSDLRDSKTQVPFLCQAFSLRTKHHFRYILYSKYNYTTVYILSSQTPEDLQIHLSIDHNDHIVKNPFYSQDWT